MSKLSHNQRAWTDLILYSFLAGMNAVQIWLDKIGEIDISSIRWFMWTNLIVGVSIAVSLAAKSTLSQSWTNAPAKDSATASTTTAVEETKTVTVSVEPPKEVK